jgi:opacity protein-like surface antigen
MRWQRWVGTMLVFTVAVLGRGVAQAAEAEPGAAPAEGAPPAEAAPAPPAEAAPAPPAEVVPAPSADAATAPVAEESEYGRRGWYAGLGFIYAPSAFKLDDAESQLPSSRVASNSLGGNNKFGLDARVGYRLRPRWALEGNYQYVPGFEVERGGAGKLVDLNVHGLWLNGKMIFLTEDTFQPYLLGGAGMLHVNSDATIPGFSADGTGFAGRMGAGADVWLRRDLVVNVEFSVVLPTGPVADVRYLPLVFGAQYRF